MFSKQTSRGPRKEVIFLKFVLWDSGVQFVRFELGSFLRMVLILLVSNIMYTLTSFLDSIRDYG